MRKIAALVPILLLAAPLSAFASHSDSNVDIYYMSSGLDISDFGDGSGDGFGIKGQFSFAPGLFITGEYQSTTIDEFDIDDDNEGSFETDLDFDQFRVGLGGSAPLGPDVSGRLRIEYFDAEYDGEDFDDGFGMHAGLQLDADWFSVYGDIGYLMLGDADGPEFLVGATFEVLPSLGVFVDYRFTSLEIDDGSGDEFDFDDIRVGARLSF